MMWIGSEGWEGPKNVRIFSGAQEYVERIYGKVGDQELR